MSGKIIYDEILQETADSVECLNENIFACATYQLLSSGSEGSSSERVGSIHLYSIDNHGNNVNKSDHTACNAVLDMKWKFVSHKPVLNVADAKGYASFYELTLEEKLHKFKEENLDRDSLCLSTDWNVNPKECYYSMSNGNIIRYNVESAQILDNWNGHYLEAWIVAADSHNQNIIFTGADDCRLKMWDLRNILKPCYVNKSYSMGVCSIHSNPFFENYFAVGSYDETVSVFDKRKFSESLCSINTGGGVWRLKWHPKYGNIILAACMHDGFKIISFNKVFNEGDVLLNYDKHSSLAYGVDWISSKNISEHIEADQANLDQLLDSLVASCSFYDKKLTVWKILK